MTSIEQIGNFMTIAAQVTNKGNESAFQDLANALQQIEVEPIDQGEISDNLQQQYTEKKEQKFEGLEQLQLIESRAVANKNNEKVEQKSKKKRIKQIEEQKKRIADQLQELEQQIEVIKGKNGNENLFKKHTKIQRDQSAQKHAEQLVKQLKNQRKQIENRKRQQFQKSLIQIQKQEEERRKIREEELLRAKEERRLAIIQRMEQEKKRKEERRLIQAQSNQLIVRLKKQEELQKMASMAPSQIVEVDQRKRALDKKNIFNLQEIQEHDRKYRQLKSKAKKEKEQRAQSLKINRQFNSHKYSKNIWIQKIEEEDQKKKQQQRQNDERKKNQLEKRLKYGELVKNIFLPKRKDKENDNSSDRVNQKGSEKNLIDAKTQQKPRTPQDIPTLPKIKTSKNKTQNSKMFRQESLPGMRNSRKLVVQKKQQIKQFDPQDEQKQMARKIRELELRKQTKERLKKIQNQSLNKAVSQQQKVKYKNYLGEVKVKKDEANDWKKIISNQKLTQQQKYQEIIKKASDLQARAKKKQDKTTHREADQESVNLYIGSIQAKLALLQKF